MKGDLSPFKRALARDKSDFTLLSKPQAPRGEACASPRGVESFRYDDGILEYLPQGGEGRLSVPHDPVDQR